MFTKLKFFAASAMLVATFSACSDDSSPNGISNDLNIVNNTDKTQASTKLVSETPSDEISDKIPGESIVEDVQPSILEQPSNVDSASLDSIITILFPDGITVDTSRHDPDSVGVWHFYDSKESHMNPAFAYGEMTDPRDGNVYKTTTIGGQVWMAENLNYFDIEGAASSVKNDWCYWDKPENCESAGRLYTWKVAQRICPEGWRLPTNEDWAALLTAVGADSVNTILWRGAGKLKSVNGWENEGSGTDDYGFTALPAGKRFFGKVQDGFSFHGCSSLMWSSTEAEDGAADTLAFQMSLDCSNDNVIINTVKKIDGLSVRCVKE